jgi:hypothetical protein
MQLDELALFVVDEMSRSSLDETDGFAPMAPGTRNPTPTRIRTIDSVSLWHLGVIRLLHSVAKVRYAGKRRRRWIARDT